MNQYLYCAYALDVSFEGALKSDPKESDMYSIIETPILEQFPDGVIHVEGCWMINTLCSVSYFDKRDLNEPHRLSYGWAYYSLDADKCREFLEVHRDRNNEYIDDLMRYRFPREWVHIGMYHYGNDI